MADLRDVFTGLGYGNVRTVLASGNVVFDAGSTDPGASKTEIEAALESRFGYQAFVFVFEQAGVRRSRRRLPVRGGPGRLAHLRRVRRRPCRARGAARYRRGPAGRRDRTGRRRRLLARPQGIDAEQPVRKSNGPRAIQVRDDDAKFAYDPQAAVIPLPTSENSALSAIGGGAAMTTPRDDRTCECHGTSADSR